MDNSEEETGRRTRNTRSKKVAVPVVSPRASRRTRGSKNIEEVEQEEDLFDETNDEHADDMHFEQLLEDNDNNLLEESKDNSSNLVFEEFPTNNLTYEPSNTREDTNHNQGKDDFMANIAEENANSFPSCTGADDNSNEENNADVTLIDSSNDSKNNQEYNDYQMVDETLAGENHAIIEKQEGEDPEATDLDAENISDDEIPAPEKEQVPDAEEVSDEDLPAPKRAELPADTEVVSEEEEPLKKDGKRKLEDYDPSDPTDEIEAPEKKIKTEGETDKVEKPKPQLPELDNHWKPVNEDSTNFPAWTLLLQYVDAETDIEAAREAYDAFLAHYPYCYGYWRKYADFEKRNGSKKKCEEVFERGLKAIPLSVDLWIHFLTHVRANNTEDRVAVRNEFERALNSCGLEFRSDKLWEAYIKWENEEKNVMNIVAIYDRLLATPTQGYTNHFDNFKEVVANNQIQSLLPLKEFKKLRDEIRRDVKASKDLSEPDDQLPPGEDEPDDHVRNEEEAQAMKDKMNSRRKKIHKATVAAVSSRWAFEEGIKRPYFHVKPLERCQLKNWKEYLDYEIEQGDQRRILVLFERCLIACALYDDFWLKLIRYLESHKEQDDYENKTRDAYERACSIHHPDKPNLHMMWAAFEESHSCFDKGAEILQKLEKTCPNLLQVAYRRINLERRRGDYDKCIQLYDHYITIAKNKNIAASLSIKYARFLHKLKNDVDGAFKTLRVSLEKDPNNSRIALQMIDLALQRNTVDEKEIVEIIDSFMVRESIEADQKVLFAQRKVEFLEDFGSTAVGLQEAQRTLQQALAKANEAKKKTGETSPPTKKAKDSSVSASANGATAYSGGAYNYQNPSYYSTNNSQYPSSSYGSGGYDYNQWNGYQQSSYGNYSGQWSGGYGGASYY